MEPIDFVPRTRREARLMQKAFCVGALSTAGREPELERAAAEVFPMPKSLHLQVVVDSNGDDIRYNPEVDMFEVNENMDPAFANWVAFDPLANGLDYVIDNAQKLRALADDPYVGD